MLRASLTSKQKILCHPHLDNIDSLQLVYPYWPGQMDHIALQAQKAAFTEEAGKRASGGANRYGQQEVCPLSGVIINKEESRVRDHKNGRNYR